MSKNSTILYGIANCDTVKRTRKILDSSGVEYTFHDYKKAGLDATLAATFLASIPVETLINKRGTTWRKLTSEQQDSVDIHSAPQLIMANPSVVRRPIIRHSKGWIVGFDESQLQTLVI